MVIDTHFSCSRDLRKELGGTKVPVHSRGTPIQSHYPDLSRRQGSLG